MSLLRVTLCVHFAAARDAETRRGRQQQRGNAAATVAVALQAKHEETTRLAGEYKGEYITSIFFVEGTAVLRKKIRDIYIFGVCTYYRALSLRNLVSGYECGRVFPAGVGPGSPSRDAANWLPSRFSLSV